MRLALPADLAATPRDASAFAVPSGNYYGGVGVPKQSGAFKGVRTRRRRLNGVAICQNMFMPWALFCLLFAMMSFSTHHEHPNICILFAGLSLVLVLVLGVAGMQALRKRMSRSDGVDGERSWIFFLFLACAVAWVAALVAGDMNYVWHLQPFYDWENLNTYPSVDPSALVGAQAADAGRITFVEGSVLDLTKAMGFRNEDIYCAAPITKGNQTLATYDFWAVGMNCCSGNSADFQCPDYSNPHARAGLRLMRDDQRPFYRLAVQQAEATYNIKAGHPLFFEWMQDPNEKVMSYRDDGFRFYQFGVATHFVCNAFAVIAASVGFSKIGFY